MSRTTPEPVGSQVPPGTLTADPHGRSPRGRAIRGSAVASLVAGALLLSGCAVPSVASMSPDLPKRPGAAPTTSPSATPTAVPAAGVAGAVPASLATPVDRGDLASGSLTRKLAAGSRTVVLDYWTAADPATLSPTSSMVLQLSAHIEDADVTHAVKVSRFFATADDGTTTTTLSDDRGEFVITPPFSYGTALTVRPANPAATSVTVQVQLDLLIETIPGSGAYFRQTVLDSVRIALPGANSVAPTAAASQNSAAAPNSAASQTPAATRTAS